MPSHGRQHEVDHGMTVGRGVVLRPSDGLHVVIEVLCAFAKVRKIPVREPQLIAFCVPLGKLYKIGPDGVPDAATPRVQHHPPPLRLVETDFDEMIAAAQRAHLVNPVLGAWKTLLNLRMRADYAL